MWKGIPVQIACEGKHPGRRAVKIHGWGCHAVPGIYMPRLRAWASAPKIGISIR
jgi:hypothetical protein